MLSSGVCSLLAVASLCASGWAMLIWPAGGCMKKRRWLRICIHRNAAYSTRVSAEMPTAWVTLNSPVLEV
ncbi:hypothetical protein D3C72_1809180 [compost metagenome]